jgi:uncharacterized membrane protein YphA (DoxX/SURF4 family)
MAANSHETVGAWISRLLRLAVGSLFFSAAVRKLGGGAESIAKTVDYFQKTFEGTWLPGELVTAHAYATPFVEALIVLWLITGIFLAVGWVFATLFMITLAFGLSVAGEYGGAANDYTYVLIFCVGLYFSRFDSWRLSYLRTRTKTEV